MAICVCLRYCGVPSPVPPHTLPPILVPSSIPARDCTSAQQLHLSPVAACPSWAKAQHQQWISLGLGPKTTGGGGSIYVLVFKKSFWNKFTKMINGYHACTCTQLRKYISSIIHMSHLIHIHNSASDFNNQLPTYNSWKEFLQVQCGCTVYMESLSLWM